ncbi:MAG: EamA family transporter [Candidatus Njordarchaeia archaeon]
MGGEVLGIIMGISASLSWALAAVFYRKSMGKLLNPLITNVFRVPLAVLVLFLILVLSGNLGSFLDTVSNVQLFLMLIFGTIIMNIFGDGFYLLSLRNIGVSYAYPLSYTYPILVAILALVLLNEELFLSLIVGALVGILGIWLISSGGKESRVRKFSFSKGIVYAILASLSWSFGIVLYKVLVEGLNPIIVGTWKLILLFLISSPSLLLVKSSEEIELEKNAIKYALVGGVFGVGVGDWFFYISMDNIGAAFSSALTTSSPLLSLLLAKIFLNEKITPKKATGTTLIIIGIILIILRF